eukprot:3422404-Rhodomonas_salina.2
MAQPLSGSAVTTDSDPCAFHLFILSSSFHAVLISFGLRSADREGRCGTARLRHPYPQRPSPCPPPDLRYPSPIPSIDAIVALLAPSSSKSESFPLDPLRLLQVPSTLSSAPPILSPSFHPSARTPSISFRSSLSMSVNINSSKVH